MTDSGQRSDAERLARLEAEMAVLRVELAKLRERIGHKDAPAQPSAAPGFSPPPPPPPQPPPPPRANAPQANAPRSNASWQAGLGLPSFTPKSGRSFEEMLGRYGVIAVATVTLLIGVGIFLSWAIEHGLLGPTTRVVLGYIGAAALAYGGMHMRARGTREFANVLLAMALGVVHLVSWTAGPLLHVLPTMAALAIGTAASIVLAEFALRHDEQALCAVGFGGAAIAPFLIGDDTGSLIALSIYGVVVIALAVAALRNRPWRGALTVILLSFAIYQVVMVAGANSISGWPWIVTRLGLLFPVALLALLIPFAHSRYRRELIRVAGSGVVFAALFRVDRGPDFVSLGLVIVATVLTMGALDLFRLGAIEREDREAVDPLATTRNAFLDALILPLGFFGGAIATTPGAYSNQAAVISALFAVAGMFMTHHTRGDEESEKYAASATVAALWIVPAALYDHWMLRVLGAVAMGVVLVALFLRIPSLPFAVGSIVSLGVAANWGQVLLDQRVQYDYLPFATMESFMSIVVIGGWLMALRLMSGPAFQAAADARTRQYLAIAFNTGAVATAFFWGRTELTAAWSRGASTALVIVYYAACGALMIWIGRHRNVRALRIIGLGLALLAAAKAVGEVFVIPNVAVRIAVFFSVSAFLIAVGYWYRKGADDDPAPIPAPAG